MRPWQLAELLRMRPDISTLGRWCREYERARLECRCSGALWSWEGFVQGLTR